MTPPKIETWPTALPLPGVFQKIGSEAGMSVVGPPLAVSHPL